MYQKDYILRMIEMIGELIMGILGLIKKGEFYRASESIEYAYHNFLKQDAAFFTAIQKEKLTDTLLKEHNFTNGHLEILSELFYAEAELSYAQGKSKRSIEFYEKALILNEFISRETKEFNLDRQTKMSYLQDRIKQLKEKLG
jgi:tetratricopeptide (TPR) repeat protein